MAVLSQVAGAVSRSLAKRGWVGLVAFMCLTAGLFGQVVSKEYQVKAVFLFNFAQFVEWPPTAFATAQTPLVIGVLGEDPFGPFLEETVQGEKIGGRELAVRRFRRIEEVDACHLLFIGGLSNDEQEEALAALRTRGTLTVGESESFIAQGGMIRFFTENNRIRLRINPDAAKRAGLTISSRLLRPAEIVGDGRE